MEAEEHSNVDFILDKVEKYKRSRFRPEDRQRIHDDLSRSREIVEWLPTNDRPFKLAPSVYVSDPRLRLIHLIISQADIRNGVITMRSFEVLAVSFPTRVQELGLVPRSWAGYYLLEHLADRDFFPTYVDLTMWERDDIQDMERHRRHHAIYTVWHRHPSSGLDEGAYRTLFAVADQIEAANLIPRIYQYRISWDGITVKIYNRYRGRPWTEIVPLAFAAVWETIAVGEEAEFGRGSPTQRAAADEFDRNRGALSPECDFWIYIELEFWSRAALRNAPQSALCVWLRSRGEIEVQGDCEQLPRDEVLSAVREAVNFVSKAPLCALLQTIDAAPPVPMNWDDVTHHNVRVLPYLSPEIRQRVVDARTLTMASVQTDLIDKLSLIPIEPLRYVPAQVNFVTLTPQSPPLELSPETETRHIALITLIGVATVSLVDSRADPTTTPEIVALREGELLVLHPQVDGYSILVVRAGTQSMKLFQLNLG